MPFKATSIDGKINTRLPEAFHPAHELCFLLHDIMLTLLRSGEEQRAFTTSIKFSCEEEATSFAENDDLFAWLAENSRTKDRENVLVTQIFPAALSDMLSNIYEALEASRKGKLGVAFSLIRKPIQETLYLFECIAVNREAFADHIVRDPTKLALASSGGPDAHLKRISAAIQEMGLSDILAADYISELRYNKGSQDSFGGICDKAIHLFTGHKLIRTEPLNVNFIFSNDQSRHSQWSFFYARLPYLMIYSQLLVEHVCSSISPTHPLYTDEISRRVAAGVLVWWKTVPNEYHTSALTNLAEQMASRLGNNCRINGYPDPSEEDLHRMVGCGAFPGESAKDIAIRLQILDNLTKK